VIKIPSSLTRKETALLAATVETVSRVGPCDAKIKLVEIRDVRETKRKKIIERAAELLKEWDQKSLEPSEIEERIDTDIKLGEIIAWGPEELPAGPEVDSDSELIIVEGRADVLNLLRIGLKNTIAVQGTQVPKSIVDLSKQKENVIAFVDGDRGGTIILNELLQLAKIDYIARAPEGYEVEELTRKQMIKSLQNKKPINDSDEIKEVVSEKEYSGKDATIKKLLKKIKIKNHDLVIDTINNLPAGVAIGYNKNTDVLFEIPISELFDNLGNYKESQVLIIDGILTKRLLSLVTSTKIKFIACKNKEEDLSIPENIVVFFF
jgi:DNA primase